MNIDIDIEKIVQNNVIFGALILGMGLGLIFISEQICCGSLLVGGVAYWGLSALLKRI